MVESADKPTGSESQDALSSEELAATIQNIVTVELQKLDCKREMLEKEYSELHQTAANPTKIAEIAPRMIKINEKLNMHRNRDKIIIPLIRKAF